MSYILGGIIMNKEIIKKIFKEVPITIITDQPRRYPNGPWPEVGAILLLVKTIEILYSLKKRF